MPEVQVPVHRRPTRGVCIQCPRLRHRDSLRRRAALPSDPVRRSQARPRCPAVRLSIRMAAARLGRYLFRQHRNPGLAGCSGWKDAHGVP